MVFDIQSLRDQGYELNSALEVHIKNVGLPKDNLELNEQSTNNFKSVLFKAKETQEKLSRKVEKDAKRFKLMQKYGDILRKLETLLSLLPSSLENLSVDELTKKLEELIKTRKRNEQQIIFIFCQNLFTNTLNNLLTIEKDFQEGNISQRDAHKSIKNIKHELEYHELQIPINLDDTKKSVFFMVEQYENAFDPENTDLVEDKRSPLVSTDFNDRHQILLDKLHKDTQSMIANVQGITERLENFEPVVDLTKVTEQLSDTEELLHQETWEVDDLSPKLTDLEFTTDNLIDLQTAKNKEAESISSQIKEATETAEEISSTSMAEISRETFIDMSARAQTSRITANQVIELLESNPNSIPSTISSYYANVIISQMDEDKEFAERIIAKDPNASIANREEYTAEEAELAAQRLRERTVSIEIENGAIKIVEQADPNEEDEEENPDQTNA